MKTVGIREAQSRLPELIDSASMGEEILITKDEKTVARLTSSGPRPSLRDHQPVSVGAVLRPVSSDDDLLGEMLNP